MRSETPVEQSGDAEFDDEAGELADRIVHFDGEDRIAAACRGSANPAALAWLAETLQLTGDENVADLGAGLGGPAAWMRTHIGCDVIASDPSSAASHGARRLFGLTAVRAEAGNAPFVRDAFDAVLLLGVLSVVDERGPVLREALRIGRRVGVLDYCSATATTLDVGGSRFASADTLANDVAAVYRQVRMRHIDEPAPASWGRAVERAHAGVAQPDSERDVVDAVETGRLVLYALVGW